MPAARELAREARLAIAARREAERVLDASPMKPMSRWPRSSRCRAARAPPATSSPITRGIAVDRWRMDVDEHDRNGRSAEHGRGLGVRRQRHDEQPVGPLRLGERAQVVVALLDRLDVVDDEVELAVGQDGVDAAQPLGGLRSGQERDDHADGQRPAEAEAARRGARREAELLHHREDPIARLRVDDLAAVQRPRRRRDADAGVAGDVADGDRLLRHGSLVSSGWRRMKPVT